jgi:membrane protease YdiL (CAAX protease family)
MSRRHFLEIALLFAAFFLPGFLWQVHVPEGSPVELGAYILQFLIFAIPQIILLVYILALQPELPLSAFGIVKPRLGDLPAALLCWAGLLALVFALGFLVSLFPGSEGLLNRGFRWKLPAPALIPAALLFSLVTGYREELFFRAYLLTRFTGLGAGRLPAVLLSSMLFAAGHIYQGPAGFGVALLQGCYFSLLFLRRRNLHRLAWAHGLYNALILMVSLYNGGSLPFSISFLNL